MPKSDNQKQKILYIMDYLQRNSREDRPVKTAELLSMLERQHNIVCDRKTIYSDIAALQDYGVDIVSIPGKGSFVAADKQVDRARIDSLLKQLDEAAAELIYMDITKDELIRRISEGGNQT